MSFDINSNITTIFGVVAVLSLVVFLISWTANRSKKLTGTQILFLSIFGISLLGGVVSYLIYTSFNASTSYEVKEQETIDNETTENNDTEDKEIIEDTNIKLSNSSADFQSVTFKFPEKCSNPSIDIIPKNYSGLKIGIGTFSVNLMLGTSYKVIFTGDEKTYEYKYLDSGSLISSRQFKQI